MSTLAESFGLAAPTIERAGMIEWTQAASEEGRLRVVVKGPHAIESNPGGRGDRPRSDPAANSAGGLPAHDLVEPDR